MMTTMMMMMMMMMTMKVSLSKNPIDAVFPVSRCSPNTVSVCLYSSPPLTNLTGVITREEGEGEGPRAHLAPPSHLSLVSFMFESETCRAIRKSLLWPLYTCLLPASAVPDSLICSSPCLNRVMSTLGKLNWPGWTPTVWSPSYCTLAMNSGTAATLIWGRERTGGQFRTDRGSLGNQSAVNSLEDLLICVLVWKNGFTAMIFLSRLFWKKYGPICCVSIWNYRERKRDSDIGMEVMTEWYRQRGETVRVLRRAGHSNWPILCRKSTNRSSVSLFLHISQSLSFSVGQYLPLSVIYYVLVKCDMWIVTTLVHLAMCPLGTL